MTIEVGDDGYVHPVWSFGDKVRKARSVAGMDQRQFATAISVGHGSLAQWETDRARPRDMAAVARRIEMLTRVPAAWLLGEGDDSHGPDGGPGTSGGLIHRSWGKALDDELRAQQGGLKRVVDAIVAELGAAAGSRNTFAKLRAIESAAELSGRDAWRAWLMIATLDQDPSEWGIAEGVVPPAIDATDLHRRLVVRHQGLEPRTRWLNALPSSSASEADWEAAA